MGDITSELLTRRAARSGDSGDGYVVRLHEDRQWIMSVVVRASGTLSTTEGSEHVASELEAHVADAVRSRAQREPAWLVDHRGDNSVSWILTSLDELAVEA